jgi:hypothetical protein
MTTTTSSVDIGEIGLTALAKGGINPVVDIVFIHGLQGHPYKTLIHYGNVAEKSTRSEKKFSFKRLLGGKANSPDHPENTVYWPRGVLPRDIVGLRDGRRNSCVLLSTRVCVFVDLYTKEALMCSSLWSAWTSRILESS